MENKRKILCYISVILIIILSISAASIFANLFKEKKYEPGMIDCIDSNSTYFPASSCVRRTVDSFVSFQNGKFVITSGASEGKERYADFNVKHNSDNILFSDYDFITVDFDIDMINMYDEYRLLGVFRNDNGRLAHRLSLYVYLNYQQDLNRTFIKLKQGNEMKIVGTVDKPTAHITLAYSLDHTSPNKSVVQWYVDGVYVGSATGFLTNDVSYLSVVRLYCYAAEDKADDDAIVMSNYQVNAFDRGYEGPIMEIFEDYDLKLQDCKDSVLY